MLFFMDLVIWLFVLGGVIGAAVIAGHGNRFVIWNNMWTPASMDRFLREEIEDATVSPERAAWERERNQRHARTRLVTSVYLIIHFIASFGLLAWRYG
ncbi:MAG: hypothetical protein TEF_01535 [Rhizobiales bacterium NRL2]|jgi:hypothetical protein|nr:MAG: hypothetical protein TEF_01535 [Rhizobiales bacterium NRL2]